MAKVKLTKNLAKNHDEYTRYFGNFSGVDFSSDHTEVADYRFAYLKNMYKDYRSGQGQAVETIPGFRRILDYDGRVNGVHIYKRHERKLVGDKYVEGFVTKIVVHVDDAFWIYDEDFTNGKKADVVEYIVTSPDGDSVIDVYVENSPSISFMLHDKMYILDGKSIFVYRGHNYIEPFYEYIPTTYINAVTSGGTIMTNPDNSWRRSEYTTYTAYEASIGEEYEQRNITTPWYKMTFIAQDSSYTNCFQMNSTVKPEKNPNFLDAENQIRYPENAKVIQYGVELPWAFYTEEVDESVYKKDNYYVPEGYPNAVVKVTSDGMVELAKAPPAPEKNPGYSYPPGHAGIEIYVKNPVTRVAGTDLEQPNPLAGCRVACIYDGRVFLSGHPKYPHMIFWCGRNAETGYADPTYFGELNCQPIGISNAPITALMPISDKLMVLRENAVQDGAIAYLSGQLTGDDIYSKIYTVTQGLPGYGCLGACCNFFDDPIFVSKLGVEAMGQLSIRNERAVEHRSSMIDAMLLNCDLRKASIVEWGGYMLLLVDGKIFMADSRQRFSYNGAAQYEWYYLEDIGVYQYQLKNYVYAKIPQELIGQKVEFNGKELTLAERTEKIGQTAIDAFDGWEPAEEPQDAEISIGRRSYYLCFVERDGEAVAVEYAGAMDGTEFVQEYTGGTFDPAVKLFCIGEDLYFYTESGTICKFNFDKRDPETHTIPNKWYTFDGRRIESGAAVKMDNCGVPHLRKTTVRRSVVIKTRSAAKSTAKIFVRTNNSPYTQVDRLIGGQASFEGAEFVDMTFGTVDGEKNLFAVKEREKGWVEKQYYVKSDEFIRPFALYYIAYCYYIAGRYKD